MSQNLSLLKAEQWFEYYKKVYSIYVNNIYRIGSDLSILLSFSNYISEEEYNAKGQIVKLELRNRNETISEILLKTTENEQIIFQYIWLLTVNHFIEENYSKASKVRILSPDNSMKSYKYLISEREKNQKSIARANFCLAYKKNDYDEMLHYLVLNHNKYISNDIIVNNFKKEILDNSDLILNKNLSNELNSTFDKSRKTYEHLLHCKFF